MKKRIALAVVAALAGGLMVAGPAVASAAASATVTQVAGTGDGGSGGIAGPANTLQVTVAQYKDASDQYWASYVTVSGAGATITADNSDSSTVASTGLSATITKDATSVIYTIATPQTGDITVNVYKSTAYGASTFGTTAAATKTITVRATGVSGTVTAANSTSIIAAGDTTTVGATDATILADATASATPKASIKVSLADANDDTTTVAGKTIAVAISGPGLVSADTGTTVAGDRARAASKALTTNVGYVRVYSDGTSGTATITITVGSTTVGTETVKFYGDVTKIVATQGLKVANTTPSALGSNSSTSYAAKLVATDANGNAASLTAANVTATSSDTTVLQSATTCAASGDNDGVYYCNVTGATGVTAGKTATITFKYTNAAATVLATDAISFNTGSGTVAAVTAALDKASYTPGEKATLTVTLKDKNGAAVADGPYVNLLAAAAKASQSVVGSLPSETVTVKGGVATYTFYMPLASGPVSVSFTTGTANLATAAQDATVSASATVAAPADAQTTANAAAIATLNTNVATLQTTVASLVASMTAQIKVINAALVKIAKKLKVKI